MFLARVYITLKPGVNDPEGQTILGALRQLGFDSVRDVRSGKYFQLRLDEASQQDAELTLQGMCDRLLANPLIEEFRFELEQAERD